MENKNNEQLSEEESAVNDLKDMIETLNELPTDVLEQLAKNLNEIDEDNDTTTSE